MTTTETGPQTDPETTTADAPTADWDAQFAELKTRYPKVREPILAALNILTANPDIELDDAKALAADHGVRITAASVSAAQRLLAQQDGAPAGEATRKAGVTTTRRTRRSRAGSANLDAEALLRQAADRLRKEGEAEADRLRAAMRKAIAMLQAAVEA